MTKLTKTVISGISGLIGTAILSTSAVAAGFSGHTCELTGITDDNGSAPIAEIRKFNETKGIALTYGDSNYFSIIDVKLDYFELDMNLDKSFVHDNREFITQVNPKSGKTVALVIQPSHKDGFSYKVTLIVKSPRRAEMHFECKPEN